MKPENDSSSEQRGKSWCPWLKPFGFWFLLGGIQRCPLGGVLEKRRGRRYWEEKWLVFEQGVLVVFIQTQGPVEKFNFFVKLPFSDSHTKLSLTTLARTDSAWRPFLLPKAEEEGIIEKKNNNKNPYSAESWGQLHPSFPWCIISFSPDKVAEEIKI